VCVHKSLHLVQNHLNPVNIIIYACRIHLNVVLPSTPSSSVWFFFSCFPSKTWNFSGVSGMPYDPAHLLLFDYLNNIWQAVWLTEPLIIWLPPFPNIVKDHSSFRTLGTTDTVPQNHWHSAMEPLTQCHITEDLNPQGTSFHVSVRY
jgi:hypothetical protein